MAITVLTKKHLRYVETNGVKRQEVIAFISVGSASELPDIDGIDGLLLHEASGAWDISSGTGYGLTVNNGSGTWNPQPNGIPFNYFEEV